MKTDDKRRWFLVVGVGGEGQRGRGEESGEGKEEKNQKGQKGRGGNKYYTLSVQQDSRGTEYEWRERWM